MKKNLVVLLFLVVAIGIWLYVNKRPQPEIQAVVIAKTNRPSHELPETNLVVATFSSNNGTSTLPVIEPANKEINALGATNLDQWKLLIPGLKYSNNFGKWDSWIMEKQDRSGGVPITFGKNDQSVSYQVRFIDLRVFKDSGQIRRVEIHSPIMNIDKTRELGLQLCKMLGVDSKGFTDWCDKVGNHWLDAPLYATGTGSYGFQTLQTFNNDDPWYINFIIQNP